MDKRYQVFVSSTFRDLQEERSHVIQALLELDCIPSGMELFPAADEDQWSYIQQIIDDCDYYVVVLAGKYGSISPATGKSYTQMEYEYAVAKGKPVIAFLHGNLNALPMERCEQDKDKREMLEQFRAQVETKLCKHWSNPDQLSALVSRSMVQLMKRSPAVGWVRADYIEEESEKRVADLLQQINQLEKELSEQSALVKNSPSTKPNSVLIPALPDESGVVTLNYSNHDGRFRIGTVPFDFETMWSKSSDTNIICYNDTPSIKGVALAAKGSLVNEIVDASSLDFTSRTRRPEVGQMVILQNSAGYYAALEILSIRDDTRGGDADELSFRFWILTDKSANFSNVGVFSTLPTGFTDIDFFLLSRIFEWSIEDDGHHVPDTNPFIKTAEEKGWEHRDVVDSVVALCERHYLEGHYALDRRNYPGHVALSEKGWKLMFQQTRPDYVEVLRKLATYLSDHANDYENKDGASLMKLLSESRLFTFHLLDVLEAHKYIEIRRAGGPSYYVSQVSPLLKRALQLGEI